MKKRQKAAGKIPKQNHEAVWEAATEQSAAAEQKAAIKQSKSAEQKTASKQESAEKPKPRMKYKDTIFRMLFNNKENLLSLYNAVNGTAYMDADSLEITTLENAVYTNYKNDVSFVFDFELMLYEHQSTVNPNMPLRDLSYVTTILQGITREENLYGSELVKIPAPGFVIFYNGIDLQPVKQILRLSDAFLKKQELELLVTVYNINWGCNRELMKACCLLEKYAQYVDQVRKFAEMMPFEEAVEKAENREEAIAVSSREYKEEMLRCRAKEMEIEQEKVGEGIER